MRIGKWEITADAYQYILCEIKQYTEKSKYKGEYRGDNKYYGSLDSLMEAIVDEEIKEVLQDVTATKDTLVEALKNLNEEVSHVVKTLAS